MIHLFRKIRRNMLSNNKVSRYILYALGEILLVIIGILIALQVNEWNQGRKNIKEEQIILSNLKSEFSQNDSGLEDVWGILKNNQNSCLQLMELMNQDASKLEKFNIDSLIYWSIEYYPFNSSNNVFADLVQSGRLQLIQDDTLRNKLFEWSTEMENYRNSFEEYQHFVENQMLVYLIEHLALKNIDQYSPLSWNKPSTFQSDVVPMFEDRKYENLIDNHLYHASLIQTHFEILEKLIDDILSRC